jgi:dTDP-4-dehydrorhamnose reductase
LKILVTGAGGMLGTDFVDAAESASHDVVALAHADLDITDVAETAKQIAAAAPDVVINCAAWTDVDGAEDAEAEATGLNATAAGALAAAAADAGAMVVYPSTDYVFDGRKGEAYAEGDKTRPLSAYGRSKLAGEQAVAEANPQHFIVRTSWVFGPHGKNFVETMLRLGEERDEVLVVADQIGCPTYTGHLAEGLIELIEFADEDAYGVHHMTGAGHCSWSDFAREIFSQSGVDCQVKPATTAQVPRPAPRPAYGVLAVEREGAVMLPPWRQGLGDYLKRRVAIGARG